MATTNIRTDVDDKFYRYKMPVLQTKVEGKGNGIKTVLPNISDVARALSRPPAYPTKFFGCELGAQTTLDEKKDRYIVNGAHDAARLRELLDGFIDKFVLCPACKNPETDLFITKDETILRDCKACGQRQGVDMRHKLTTFILKNPPAVNKKSKSKKGASKADGDASPPQEENGDDGGSDDELTRRLNAEAAELPSEAHSKTLGEDWSVDVSKEAVEQRQKKLAAGIEGLAIRPEDEDEEDKDSPYTAFERWLVENRSTAKNGEILEKAKEFGIEGKHKTMHFLVQGLFTANAAAEVEGRTPLLRKMATSEKHQKSILGGIEYLVGVAYPETLEKVPDILMAFYQNDILDEDVIKSWGTHVSKKEKYVDKATSKAVKRASQKFLKWLDEAEEE